MRNLPITGEYPADWKEISDRVWAEAGHRCIRCGHPYRKGEHGKGEFTPCDIQCVHGGPVYAYTQGKNMGELVLRPQETARDYVMVCRSGHDIYASWRIGTVHHFDGNKANCEWWNLMALCQRCHLTIQSRVNPDQPYVLDHSDWFKPYVAGFYALKYEGKLISRDEAIARIDELLAYEKLS